MSLLVNNTNGTTADYLIKTSAAGSPNLRAAHTICARVRYTGTTNIVNFPVALVANADASGSWLGRSTSDGASNQVARRYNTTGPTAGTNDAAIITNGYSGTTSWLHLAMTYDATNIRGYLNGVLTNTTASATTRTSSTTNTNLIMALAGTMMIADIAYFARALTADELLLLTAARFAPVISTGDCFGFFPFHNDSRTKDYSGRGNDLSDQAGTGNPPAADPEGVPLGWTRHSPRLILPAVVIVDLGAGTSTTKAKNQNATESKLGDLTQTANKARAASSATASKTGALTQTANLTRAASSATAALTASLTQTANKTRSINPDVTESKAAAFTGASLTRSLNSGTESKDASLTQTANLTRSINSSSSITTMPLGAGVSLTRSINPAATESKTASTTGTSLTRAAGAASESKAASVAGASTTRSINSATSAKDASFTQGAMLTISAGSALFQSGLGTGTSTTRSINPPATESKAAALTQSANKTRSIWSAVVTAMSGSAGGGDDGALNGRRMLSLGTRRRIR